MQEKLNIRFWVGLFFSLSIFAILVIGTKFSHLSNNYNQDHYNQITANFVNVEGLNKGANITVSGVSVGNVTSISIEPETFIALVKMNIEKRIKLPEDSRAEILTAGILGDKFISIIPGFSQKALENTSEIPIENTSSSVVLEKILSKMLQQGGT